MIQVLEIYKKFHCLGPECPQSCCKGWQIPVEDDTFRKYVGLTGIYGRHVRSNIAGSPDLHYVKKQLGRCPFLNSDKHCQFQDNGEEQLMPIVCRLYPRESMSFGDLTLVTFTLSCPSAAKLLIENPGRLSFVEADYPIEVLWQMNNDEPDYLRLLLSERDKLLDYFWGDSEAASESCVHVATRFSELRWIHDCELPDLSGQEEEEIRDTTALGNSSELPSRDNIRSVNSRIIESGPVRDTVTMPPSFFT